MDFRNRQTPLLNCRVIPRSTAQLTEIACFGPRAGGMVDSSSTASRRFSVVRAVRTLATFLADLREGGCVDAKRLGSGGR